jgi:ribosomal-protein-serine acetyltransferase
VESVGSGGGSDSELKSVTAEIETEIPSLKLRLLKEEDAEELSLRVDQNREHLRRWLPWLDGARDTSDQLKFIQRCSEGVAAGTAFHYALITGGEIVGTASFNTVEKLNRCATMGYWLVEPQTGRGLMTAAVKALIDDGFRHFELNRIQARVATDNYRSQAVCDRAGLKKEGVLRQSEWHSDHFLDMAVNSILITEWKGNPSPGVT